MTTISKVIVRIGLAGGFLIAAASVGCTDIETGSTWSRQSVTSPTLGRTFGWPSEVDRTIDDLQGVQPALRDAARQVIEQAFIAKGYQKGPAQGADFWIRSEIATAKRGDSYSSEGFEQYTEGTLVIYVVDPASGNWIWRGWGSARLNENNPPEVKRERMQRAIQAITKDVPKAASASK